MAKEDGNSSVESMMKSGVDSGATKSNFDDSNINNVENSVATTSDSDREYSVEYSNELMVRGSKAVEELNYAEAIRCFKRALEIRLAHFGQCTPQLDTHVYDEDEYPLQHEASALKREFENSVISFLKAALSILEQQVEDKSQLLAELMSVFQEFAPQLMKATTSIKNGMSACESIVDRLMYKKEKLSGQEETPTASELSQTAQGSSSDSLSAIEAEVNKMTDLSDGLKEMHDHLESDIKLITLMAAARTGGSTESHTDDISEDLKNLDLDSGDVTSS